MGKEPFKVGDVVTLKSGHTPMTIEYMHDASTGSGVGVVWLDREYHIQRDELLPEVLKHY